MLLVAALVLLAAGGVLATVARPSQTVTAATGGTAGTAAMAPVLVVSSAVLAAHPGPVRVVAHGSGPVLVATARAGDVTAWAKGAATTTATRLDDDAATIATTSTGGEATVPDPAGSDLWTVQATGTGSAALTVVTPAQSGAEAPAVLVSADGAAPAPTQVTLSWTVRPVPLAAWALLGVGALLAVVALAALARRGGGRPREARTVIDLRDHLPHDAPSAEPWDDAWADEQHDGEPTQPLLRPRGSGRSRR